MEKSPLLQEIIREVTGGELPSIDDIDSECQNKLIEDQEKIIRIFKERITEETKALLLKLNALESQINAWKNSPQFQFARRPEFDEKNFSTSDTMDQLHILDRYIENVKKFYS